MSDRRGVKLTFHKRGRELAVVITLITPDKGEEELGAAHVRFEGGITYINAHRAHFQLVDGASLDIEATRGS